MNEKCIICGAIIEKRKKYCSSYEEKKKEKEKMLLLEPNASEKVLKSLSILTIILGTITSILFIFTRVIVDSKYYGKEISPEGFGITVAILILTLSTWAMLRCFAEMSMNIRKIANK